MDEERPIILSNKKFEEPITITIGKHMFGRIMYEFLSLEWLISELITIDFNKFRQD